MALSERALDRAYGDKDNWWWLAVTALDRLDRIADALERTAPRKQAPQEHEPPQLAADGIAMVYPCCGERVGDDDARAR